MTRNDDALEMRVRRLHGGVPELAIVAVLILSPLIGVRSWPAVVLLAVGAILTHTATSMSAVLAGDLVVPLGL